MTIRIDQIEMRHLRMRLVAPFETSFGVEDDREALVLRVRSEGIEGWGECVAGAFPGYSYETSGTAWEILEGFFIPALLAADLDPDDPVGTYRRSIEQFRGHPQARAALEMALWDLLGKRTGVPLATLLGGVRRSVEVGVSIGIQESPERLVDRAQSYLAEGYRRVKIKIKPGRDLEDVRAMRRAFPDVRLQVDANSAYRLAQLPLFEALDDFDLLLIEQPFDEDDLLDHALLQSRLRTPVCLDESILSERHARQALEIDACRILNIKPARVGGLTEAKAIHDLCLREGVPVWCGGMLETGIGRAANLALASLPGFTLPGDISATSRYYHQDVAEPVFELNADGTIDVPRGAGLGVRVLEAPLADFTLRLAAFSP
jgi:O-succinylbenzoate synthase